MRGLPALTFALVLIPATQLLAQLGGAPSATNADDSIESLDDDHQFIEIEVTIAQWAAPTADAQPTDKQLQFEGASEEIAERITGLKEAKILSSVHRIRLVAPHRQTAMVQIGMEQPRITGSQFGPRGAVNSISYSSVGTLVRATPRLLDDNRIAVDLDVSKSGLATTADSPVLAENESGRPTKADAMRTLTVKTIAAVAEGQTVVVSGSQQPSEGEIVLLSARLKKSADKAK